MPLSAPLRLVQRFRRNSTGAPLQLYECADDQKLGLLEDAIEETIDDDFDVKLAFARLKRLYPSAAGEFKSKQQALEDAPFRLLGRPDSKAQVTKEAPYFESFVAVSYCWRDGSWSPANHLSTPADDMPVSPEMIKAIIAKTHKNEGIWIDQCCMDQSDCEEKAAVVGITDLIYKGAREVYVLLEDVSIGVPEMQMMDDFVEFGFKVFGIGSRNENEADKEYCLAAIDKIASARWFQRAWGFHEMHCHQSCIFVISGPKVIFYRHSEWLVELVAHFNATKRSKVGLPTVRPTSTIATMSGMRKMVVELNSLSRKVAVLDSLACAIPTDKIAMALNLSPLQLYYVGKSKSQDECQWLLHVLALAAGDAVELLSLARQRSPYAASIQKASLSTTSLGIQKPLSIPFAWPYTMDDDDGIASINPSSMEMTVYCLPQWIARSPTSTILSRASEFTRLAMGDLMRASQMASASTSTLTLATTSETQILTQMIACSFECGLAWIVSQARGLSSMNQELERRVEEARESAVLFDRLLESGLVTYQQLLELTERSRRALILFLCFLVFGSPLGSTSPHNSSISSSIDSQYHVNDAHSSGIPTQSWIVETQGRSPFLLIGSEKTPRHEMMVLPVALGNNTCVPLPRLWCLQSDMGSKTKCFGIVSRSYLFTFDRIEDILAPEGQALTTKDISINIG